MVNVQEELESELQIGISVGENPPAYRARVIDVAYKCIPDDDWHTTLSQEARDWIDYAIDRMDVHNEPCPEFPFDLDGDKLNENFVKKKIIVGKRQKEVLCDRRFSADIIKRQFRAVKRISKKLGEYDLAEGIFTKVDAVFLAMRAHQFEDKYENKTRLMVLAAAYQLCLMFGDTEKLYKEDIGIIHSEVSKFLKKHEVYRDTGCYVFKAEGDYYITEKE